MSNPTNPQQTYGTLIYSNADGTQEFVPTGEVRLPKRGEFYVSTRFNPGKVTQRSHQSEDAVFHTDKTIVVPVPSDSTDPNASYPSTPLAYYEDASGNGFEATGEVRFPVEGDYYVSNSTEPGVVHGPYTGGPRKTPKVIVTPLVSLDDEDDSEDGDEESTEEIGAEGLNAEFLAAAKDGAVFYDESGNGFEFTGEVRIPVAGESYVSNNSAPGIVKTTDDGNGFHTPKLIVTPIPTEDDGNELSEDQDESCNGNCVVPSGEPRNHPLARLVRNVDYQQSGRSTAALVTVLVPGTGATATMVGLGLSVANPVDKFSRSEGRRIALLRALDNIVLNAGGKI